MKLTSNKIDGTKNSTCDNRVVETRDNGHLQYHYFLVFTKKNIGKKEPKE